MTKRNQRMTTAAAGLLAALLLINISWAENPVTDDVDWPEFMADHDMRWDQLPDTWYEAPFLGNGEQGTLMYKLDNRTVRWDVGCSAAHDHRSIDDDDLSEKNVSVLNRGRHFIGHLRVELPADLTGGVCRLSLWDAEAAGTFSSSGGTIHWSTLVHAEEPVMRLEMTATGDMSGAEFVYVAEEARCPRAVRAGTEREPANPSPVLSTLSDGVQTAVHNLYAGGQTAVAWFQQQEGDTKRLWLSVQHRYPETDAVDQAVAAVRAAAAADQTEWVQTHRDWWHDYYPASFVSIGSSYWDAFYWIQQYKLACATRDNGWIIDNQGPWLQPTAWNAIWWNLNAQLSHSGGYAANRRAMTSAMGYRLGLNRDSLARSVDEAYRDDSYAIGRNTSGWDLLGHAGEPGGRDAMTADGNIARECGNLLWAMHNVDLEYRYWLDTQLRDDVLYPLLTRAVNYYRHFLVENSDGLLSLPETYSPEYRRATDCTYDLDLLRWGVGRLLELADEKGLSEVDEPLISEWQDIQTRLVPSHVDEETGRMIGLDVELTSGHRHFSHLLAIYPLRTLTPEAAADRDLIELSLNHWHSFGSGIAGYAFTGAACMAAMLGDGDGALGYMNTFKGYMQANTLYSEIGLPVMETPLHGAAAIQEMLLQSWGGRLRVLPAVPTEWTDVQFHQLRGEGGFLVSARREEGQTQWVFIQSELGGRVEVQPQIADAQWITSGDVAVSGSEGLYTIDTSAGDWVLFWPSGQSQPETGVEAVSRRGDEYRFGLWSFTVAPVDAGDNMITWSGQPVALSPRYDIGYTPVSWAWSADPETGVVFSATDVESPTVTITKTTDNPSAVTLTLTTNDGTGPEQDSLTVDVYDTACQATISTGLAAENPTDFDMNCVTNLADLAIMAARWLQEHELSEPVAKP